MEKFFIGQAVTYQGRVYRVNDIINSQAKGVIYKIAGYGASMPAYIDGIYAGRQLGDVENLFVKDSDIYAHENA